MKRIIAGIVIVIITLVDVAAKGASSDSSKQLIDGDGNVQIRGNHVSVHLNKKDASPHPRIKQKPVRSELKLPDESILLGRSEIIKALEKRFNQNARGVTTVALAGVVGMGGIGKTTLARMWGKLYGQKHPEASIWEINAETQTSLSNSFRELALALAQRPQQKEELRYIDGIKNTDQQEKQRLQFVRGCLKEQDGGWLFIFDNVESYQAIKDYLPQDSMIWGKGQVIITTRNAHFQEAEGVRSDSMINLEELSSEEGLTLFARIRFKCEPKHLSVKEQTHAMDFLKEIPPFPLDISTAARYMSHYKLSYDEYKEQLKAQSQEFNKNQENLLKETSRYTQTRYCIITLALKRMIESNKKFAELLLLISLLDSQNIPTELLDYHCNSSTTQEFLDELKRHSFIIDESKTPDFRTFSLHRSTQDMIRAYLTQTLQLKNKHTQISSIIRTLESCVNMCINNENFFAMKLYAQHLERLLKSRILSEPKVSMVTILLSCVCSNINIGANLIKVRKRLEEALSKIHCNSIADRLRKAQGLTFLGNNYHELGEPEKAINSLGEAICIFQKYCPNSIDASRPLLYLGNVYRFYGKYKNAQETLREAIKKLDKDINNSIMRAQAFAYLGVVYRDLGNYQKALDLLEKSLSILKQHRKSPTWLFWVSLHKGNVLTDIGQCVEAKKIFNDCLAKALEIYGENSLWTGWALASLARVEMECGCDKTALYKLEKSKCMFEKENSEKNYVYFELILGCLATIYTKYEKYNEAKTLLEKSLKLCGQYYGAKHLRTAKELRCLGELYLAQGNIDKAEELMHQSLHILKTNSEAPNHPDKHWSLESLATLYERKAEEAMKNGQVKDAQKFKQQAQAYLAQALTIAEAHFPKDSAHIQRIQQRLSKIGQYDPGCYIWDFKPTVGLSPTKVCKVQRKLIMGCCLQMYRKKPPRNSQ